MMLVGISVIKISFSSQRYLPINISMVFIFVLNRGQFSFPSNTTSLLHQGCAWLPGFWCKWHKGKGPESYSSITPHLITPSFSVGNPFSSSHLLVRLQTLETRGVVVRISSSWGAREKTEVQSFFFFFTGFSCLFSPLTLIHPKYIWYSWILSLLWFQPAYSHWYFWSFLNLLSASWPSSGLQNIAEISCPICFHCFVHFLLKICLLSC